MDAGRFIAACAKLRGLDLSEENTVTLDVAVNEVMPASYAMPYAPSRDPIISREAAIPASTRRGQWHELVQHLHDLRYIETAFFRAYHERRALDLPPLPPQLQHIINGIAVYLSEDDYQLYPGLASFPLNNPAEQTNWVEQHLSILVFRLAQFTSFDEELPLPAGYLVGEESCYGRSLLFRLRVLFSYGAADFAGKVYFDASLLKYLAALNASLGFTVRDFRQEAGMTRLPASIWQLLLSWDALFAAFRRANRFQESDDNGRTPYFLAYDISELTEAADQLSSNAELLRTERNRRRLSRRLANARLHVDTGGNRLGVRLLQLGLWRAGFYTGAIDGAFGLMSHTALRNMLEQEWEADRPVVKKNQLGRTLISGDESGGNFWVADLRIVGKILDAYKPPGNDEAEWEEKALWESLATYANQPDWEEELLRRQREMQDLYPAQETHPLRRVYYGLRGLLRGAFRAIGRIINWFIRKAVEVAGAIFNFVKATVKRIQEGISLFYEGFRYFSHYLLGKPFITTGPADEAGNGTIMATRLQLDFDTVNVVSRNVTEADIAGHRLALTRLRAGLEFFLRMVSDILRIIGSLTTPLGWVRLGIMIARLVRRVLSGETVGVPALLA